MHLTNARYEFERTTGRPWLEDLAAGLRRHLASDEYPLRLAVVATGSGGFTVEVTLVHVTPGERHAAAFASIELLDPRRRLPEASPFVAVQIVPTGVRCEFGGYAGDAGPATNLLALAVDRLVTHPNAVNASDLNEMADNVLYVEGKSLDDFLLGHVGLRPSRANRVGTFIDPTGAAFKDDVVHVLDAARAVKGIDCSLHVMLERELGVEIGWSQAGCAVGTVLDPGAILDAVEILVARGVQAIGGVSVIHGVTAEMFGAHLDGRLPNPSGGVEAIITHLVSKVFRLPAAHAPLPYYSDLKRRDTSNPRAAAEFISTPHYFSVLKGLARAPAIVGLDDPASLPHGTITAGHVAAVVVPASCLGGIPALAAEYADIPLIAVRENATVLDVTNERMRMVNVVEVGSYLEAAGVLLALRGGISLESLRRPLPGATEILPALHAAAAARNTGR